MKKTLTTAACIFAVSCSGQKEDAPSSNEVSTPVENDIMAPAEDAVSLFDGETLTNWKTIEKDAPFWKAVDGEIQGGSLEVNVPRNVWLVSEKNYENFELTFSVRFVEGAEDGLLKNSGVQIRSLNKGSSIVGYQIDAGPTLPKKNTNNGLGYWGNIWDEHRRGALVTAINQAELLESIQQFEGWNDYKIIANGPNIKTWINGILAHDYTEENPKIAADGIIALQAHRGGKFLVSFKDIKIKELEPTEGSQKWTDKDTITGRTKKKKKK